MCLALNNGFCFGTVPKTRSSEPFSDRYVAHLNSEVMYLLCSKCEYQLRLHLSSNLAVVDTGLRGWGASQIRPSSRNARTILMTVFAALLAADVMLSKGVFLRLVSRGTCDVALQPKGEQNNAQLHL